MKHKKQKIIHKRSTALQWSQRKLHVNQHMKFTKYETCALLHRYVSHECNNAKEKPHAFKEVYFKCCQFTIGSICKMQLDFNYTIVYCRPPDKSAYCKTIFFISHPKHVVGIQKNCLIETVLLSTQNTCLN